MIVFLALFLMGGVSAQPRISCEQIPAAMALVKSVHALNPDFSAIVSAPEFRLAFVNAVEQQWPIFLTDEVDTFFSPVGFSANVLDENICRTLENIYARYLRAVTRSTSISTLYLPKPPFEDTLAMRNVRKRIFSAIEELKHRDIYELSQDHDRDRIDRASSPEQLLDVWVRSIASRVYNTEIVLRGLSLNPLHEAYEIVMSDFDRVRSKPLTRDIFPLLFIRTLMRQLDSRSEYLTTDDLLGGVSLPQYSEFLSQDGEFVRGLRGPYLLHPSFLSVRYLKNSFRRGDQILSINGQPMSLKSDAEMRNFLESRAREELKIAFLRAGQEQTVTLHPAANERPDGFEVELRALPIGSLALIRPLTTNFRPMDLRNKILESHVRGVRGFVIDFRNLEMAMTEDWIRVFELFENRAPQLADYMVASRAGQLVPVFFNPSDQIIREAVVVLTNRKTAGWPECFAGALQKYSRGLVVSDGPTAGRVEIQTRGDIPWWRNKFSSILSTDLFSVLWFRPPPGIFNITTSYSYLPDGSAIQGRGVLPDIRIGGELREQLMLSPVEPRRQVWFDLLPDENMRLVKNYSGQLDTLRNTVRQLFLHRAFDSSHLDMNSLRAEANSALDVLALWVQLKQRNLLTIYDKKM